MAGIAGFISNSGTQEDLRGMLCAIEHRGPDLSRICSEEMFCSGVVSSKLSGDRGDGYAESGNVKIFLDGEIYNNRTTGESDAQVVLSLYEKYGRRFPAYMEGVFGCAVYDSGHVILARDSVGTRPLYFGFSEDGSLYYASEMKALTGRVPEIHDLPPASLFSSQSGVARYIPHAAEVTIADTPEKAAADIRDLLIKAVERRLKDKAVGAVLLSGGLDSSIIAAIAHQLDPSLPALTVGTADSGDVQNAIIMAKYLGIEHHIHHYSSEDLTPLVPVAVRTLESFDEDCVNGTMANLIASSFASQTTNCILSGEGGDELFGGYHLLKELDTEEARLSMMDNLIAVAYNTALQRLDRAMMGNSINYRTPFLDHYVAAYALQIPARWKIHSQDGRLIEKWILREAFKDMLAPEIYTREKLRFSRGTGTESVLDQAVADQIKTVDYNDATRNTEEGYILNSPLEMLYYRIFKEKFPEPEFAKLVGRWDPNK